MLGAVLAIFFMVGLAIPASQAQMAQSAPGLEPQQGRSAPVLQTGAAEAAPTAPIADVPLLSPTDASAAPRGGAPATTRRPVSMRVHPMGANPVSPGLTPGNLSTTGPAAPESDAPVSGTPFTDMNSTENSGLIPPDVTMAAGPTDLLTASNGRVKIFFKNGTLRSQPDGTPSSFALDNFFGTTMSFDPWAVYDPYIQRFWLFAVNEVDATSTSTYLIALSNSSEANDGFSFFPLDARAFGNNIMNQWCDYPKLGIDSQAIYLTCNMFTFPRVPPSGAPKPQFVTNKIRVMTKSQFVNNTCCSWWDFWNSLMVPAASHSPSSQRS